MWPPGAVFRWAEQMILLGAHYKHIGLGQTGGSLL